VHGDLFLYRNLKGGLCINPEGKVIPAPAPVHAPTQPPTYQQDCTGSACAQGPGSQATYNQYGAAEPKITATAQVQQQTGKLTTPWGTAFTISTNVSVQTGSLRLKCSGPVIMAGISRINPMEFISGTNGPDPNDPDTVVYELSPETLSPGTVVHISVFSMEPISVLAGSIGSTKITF